MREILIGTTNKAKVLQIRGALTPAGIIVDDIEDKDKLPKVDEDGTTAVENARKKSIAYAKALGRPVFSMDNALYLKGLSDNEQPGLNVRRFDGASERPTDEEMLEYYSKLVERLGGRVEGYWEFGICIANPQGEYEETVIKSPRIFVNVPSELRIEGYPLESIQIEPESGRYVSEMSQDEQDLFWQKVIGKPLVEFVKKVKI